MRQLPLRTNALSIKTLLCCKLVRAPHPPPPLPRSTGGEGSRFATLIDLIESPNRISAIMPYLSPLTPYSNGEGTHESGAHCRYDARVHGLKRAARKFTLHVK